MSVVIDPLKALDIWRKATVAGVRGDAPDLSARQMAVLLTVYRTAGPHTVRDLAEELSIAKPAVTRAIDKLGSQGFVKRKRDQEDMRNVFIERTVKGSVFLRNFGDNITKAAVEVE
ncbi:MAG: winged helix-turn-helix transcriptional regulator [Alphaproteobacteria bacterium]|nr:winged helix-turn-helix transcriptional regulator [Alphaproteobacteria bacterium]